MLESRMPYGRWVCNQVVDMISVCLNLYNAAFIHNCLHVTNNVASLAEL